MGKRQPRIAKEVRDNYPRYAKIVDGEKDLCNAALWLRRSDEHKMKFVGTEQLEHKEINDTMHLEVSAATDFVSAFKFKIFNPAFMAAPCFRFDSWGQSHMNFSDEPLLQRRINTPHFHRYNPDGVELAYRTDTINQNEEVILMDRKLALDHFLEEGHVRTTEPTSLNYEELLLASAEPTDPLEGVTFNE